MNLPSDLLEAVASPGGGKVVLVLGAGCSFEPPTDLPLSRKCSEQAHQRLLADGVLAAGECSDPSDLSCLADVVFKKTSSQKDLVTRILAENAFKTATPNEGYLLAAALLIEGAVRNVITLNFDLAMTTALSALGSGTDVAVIDGPHELHLQASKNVFYLHRNANAQANEWVLRTVVMEKEWRESWQQRIAVSVLTAPVVVFAGLGSPAAVLLDSTKLIKKATTNRVFQVDPGDPNNSAYFSALGLTSTDFIPLTWCEFMSKVAQRLAEQQLVALEEAMKTKVADDKLPAVNHANLVAELKSMSLVALGRLRAGLLLHSKPYVPDDETKRRLLADLLLGVAMVEGLVGSTARLGEDGVVEFARPGKPSRFFLLASGSGTHGRPSIEPLVNKRLKSLQTRNRTPEAVIVAGTSGWTAPLSPPVDIVSGAPSKSIAASQPSPPFIHLDELRASPTVVFKVLG